MIEFKNTSVFNMKSAMLGARNPMNSWDRSDSVDLPDGSFKFGPNDLDLAKRLIKAGSDHRKFLRQIFVSVNITAPLYWWKEYDTYKVATTANSTSTMHKIHSKKIEISDFSHDHMSKDAEEYLQITVNYLEHIRQKYLETKDKTYWYDLIQLLPESYNQMRTCTLSYETLRNIAHSRKNHKLDEWSVGFMDWMHALPYADDLIFYEN